MNPDLLPEEFWDWLGNGSPANNSVLAEIYKEYLKQTDNRELIPVNMPTIGGMVFVPFERMHHHPSNEETTEALEKKLIKMINKRFKEEL